MSAEGAFSCTVLPEQSQSTGRHRPEQTSCSRHLHVVSDRCLPVDWLCSGNIGQTIGPLRDCSPWQWLPPRQRPSPRSSALLLLVAGLLLQISIFVVVVVQFSILCVTLFAFVFLFRSLWRSQTVPIAITTITIICLPTGGHLRTTAWRRDRLREWPHGWTTTSKSRMASPPKHHRHHHHHPTLDRPIPSSDCIDHGHHHCDLRSSR